jgi:prefoldin subunit 5
MDDPGTELNGLKAQADFLRNSLDAISQRIAQLEKSAE